MGKLRKMGRKEKYGVRREGSKKEEVEVEGK